MKIKNSVIAVIYTNIIKMIKSKRTSWAVHVASMEEKRNSYRILVGKPERE
jgi:hypothetical protein